MPTTRIPLRLDAAPVAESETLALTQGVPFADGQLANGAPVRVADADGRPYPTQATTLTPWASDLRWTKWLLVDALLPGRLSRPGTMLFLEHGPGVEWVQPAAPVTVADAHARVTVETGCLRLEFDRLQPDVFQVLRLSTPGGWLDLLPRRPGPFLYMKDGRGRAYDSWRTAPRTQITVEDRGPVRASVCVRGWHADDDGRRLFPYVVRIHAWAGSGELRVFHTFVFDQDPERTELAGVGMFFPLALGDGPRMAFGGEVGAVHIEDARSARWLQRSDDAYEVTSDGRAVSSGRRAHGWASLNGSAGFAAVALRDAWQEFPKGVELRPDGIDLRLWPEDFGRPLKLDTHWKEEPISACVYHLPEQILEQCRLRPNAGVNLKGFFGSVQMPPGSVEGTEQSMREAKLFAEKHLRGRLVTYSDTSHIGKAWGLAKTHEFRLRFGAGRLDDGQADSWAGLVQRPPVAFPDPAYACSTGVLGATAPDDAQAFPEVAEALDLMFDRLWAGPVEECRLYGAIDYGDLVNCHVRMAGPVYRIFRNEPGFKITDLIGWHNNEAYDLAYTLAQYAFRTGRRKHWDVAESFAEHLRDVDTIHAYPPDPWWEGLTHYHNMLHWSGGPSPSHTLIHGWLLHYFLTGDRRSLDVSRASADWVLRHQEPCGIVSNREGVLRREFTSSLSNLFAFYQATWEERYGDCARRTLEWYVKTQHPCGGFPRDVFTAGRRGDEARVSEAVCGGGGGMEAYSLAEGLRLTGSPAVAKAVLKWADWIVVSVERNEALGSRLPGQPMPNTLPHSPLWHMSIPTAVLAEAYRMTGDDRYAAPMRRLIAEFPAVGRTWADMTGRTCWQYAGLAPQVLAAALSAVHASAAAEAPRA